MERRFLEKFKVGDQPLSGEVYKKRNRCYTVARKMTRNGGVRCAVV